MHRSIPFKYSTGDHLIMSSHIIGVISLDCKCFRIGVMWCTKSWDLLRSSFMQTGQVLRFHTWNSIIILTRLSNGPDKKETNNGYENVGNLECKNVLTLLLSALYFWLADFGHLNNCLEQNLPSLKLMPYIFL